MVWKRLLTGAAVAAVLTACGSSGGGVVGSLTLPSSTAPATDSNGPSPSPTPEAPAELTMGQPLSLGGTTNGGNELAGQITLSNPQEFSQPQNDYGSAPVNGVFLSFQVSLSLTTGSASFNEFDFSVQNLNGQVYSPDDGNAVGSGVSNTFGSGDLAGGQTRTGTVVFDVPNTGKVLYHPNADATPIGKWAYGGTGGPTANTPSVIAPPGGAAAGPGVGNSYPINSQGSSINVRSAPNTAGSVLGQVVQDQYVHLTCTTTGEAVTGPWGTTTLWDHIDYPYDGYVSDEWVNTASGQPVVGPC